MPKLMLTVHQSAIIGKNHRLPMAVLALEGIAVDVVIKTMPDVMKIKFSLASLEIEDHHVRDSVKKKNPKL